MSDTPRLPVLVTGGAGYIGSHTAVALYEAGFLPVLLDNLHNSSLQAVEGVKTLCGADVPFVSSLIFVCLVGYLLKYKNRLDYR